MKASAVVAAAPSAAGDTNPQITTLATMATAAYSSVGGRFGSSESIIVSAPGIANVADAA